MAKIAAIQMCSSHRVADNLQTAATLIQQAAAQGAALIVLPEMFPLMSLNETDKISAKEPYGYGVIQDFMKSQAIDHNVWIIGGTMPIAIENATRVRAACIVYNNHGEVVTRYDKVHLFDVTLSEQEVYAESTLIEPGEDIIVIDSPVGKLGLAVCYDIRFPELFRRMLDQGVEVIAIPSAFTAKTGLAHWEILLKARAIENQCYVIGANQGGRHTNGKDTFGHSMIINPWGMTVAELETDIGIITANIDLDELYRIRRSMPVQCHRKIK